MEEAGGHLGDVVEDEAVLPDNHGIHEDTQTESVVTKEPSDVVPVHEKLEDGGDIDVVAEVQHEQQALIRFVLKIPCHKICTFNEYF